MDGTRFREELEVGIQVMNVNRCAVDPGGNWGRSREVKGGEEGGGGGGAGGLEVSSVDSVWKEGRISH